MTQCPTQRKSTNVSNQQCIIKRDSCGKVRCVYEMSNLHVTREPRHQGLRGGRSWTLRMDELSDTNSTNTSEDDVRSCLYSDRHVFNKRPHSLPRKIVRSCELLHDPLRISLQKNVELSTLFSFRQISCRRYVNWIIYEDISWSKMGF